MENSKIYKTTFMNGDVHYGRVVSHKKYSPKTYLMDKISSIKSNLKNPNRIGMITKFEKRVQLEIDTVMCEIIFEGTTLECVRKKDELIIKTKNCINEKKSSLCNKVNKTYSIKKEYVKKLINPKSKETIYYVDLEWVKTKEELMKHVILKDSHPFNVNYKKLHLGKIILI